MFGALLLAITSVASVQADECIVGVIGKRVLLPCVYNGVKILTSFHITSEWRRGMEIIHTAVWIEGQVDNQNVSHSILTIVQSLAPKTGDFSMELHDIHLSDTHNYSFHLTPHGEKSSSLCTVCLTVAGHFSHPTLLRQNGVDGGETRLFCNSRGFPAPSISWLINHTQCPPETLVTTFIKVLPQSELYNVTSVLSINISADTAVTCVIENNLLNETLTATSIGVRSSTSVVRLSEHMWAFSAALCLVVFFLVVASLGLQKKWDRDRKGKQHRCGDYSSSEGTDMIVFDLEQWASLPETDV
ncbi:T-lymphocyte activation antigen CD80-like [Siphateles boraxobius]|uniref:T-lymphocyte activation antigen CD80-like n=1 Tax=Siphateles boraxobius TaxID=180520 RepID=UPI00406387A5